jgi:hypothetical protein
VNFVVLLKVQQYCDLNLCSTSIRAAGLQCKIWTGDTRIKSRNPNHSAATFGWNTIMDLIDSSESFTGREYLGHCPYILLIGNKSGFYEVKIGIVLCLTILKFAVKEHERSSPPPLNTKFNDGTTFLLKLPSPPFSTGFACIRRFQGYSTFSPPCHRLFSVRCFNPFGFPSFFICGLSSMLLIDCTAGMHCGGAGASYHRIYQHSYLWRLL